jgi:alpha-beta hydrolase superfamily lysophospholipase
MKIFLTIALLVTSIAHAASLKTRMVPVKTGLQLRVGIVEAETRKLGEVLFFHGFGDRLDNHMPLFEAWSKKGYRVISFDLPSHGESTGILNNIDLYSFNELLDFAVTVLNDTRDGSTERPLILSGWSTGGLLAVRAAQRATFAQHAIVQGLILFAPAVSVPALVGVKGFVTEATLTSNPNPPHMGKPSPVSPLLKPIFASHLLANAAIAYHGHLDLQLPMLTFVGGQDEDKYVKTEKVKEWALKNQTPFFRVNIQCAHAYHELDNEPRMVGEVVRNTAVTFTETVFNRFNSMKVDLKDVCQTY